MKRYTLLSTLITLVLMLNACGGDPKEPASASEPTALPSSDATVALGSEERVRALFSYPNSCGPVVCYQDETLAQTVKRWFDFSISRDEFQADTTVRQENGELFIDITLKDSSKGSQRKTDLPAFVSRYEEFLSHGDTAVKLARSYNTVDEKWLPNWRFLLPHGLALTNNRTLEVMNFPPVSLVLKTQDYLDSATTHRWNKMFLANGVKEENLDLYGAIVDIVPVAAPANEGHVLEKQQHIYSGGHFNSYAKNMIEMWTRIEEDPGHSKPIMTLGHEMLIWFQNIYEANLSKILDIDEITIKGERKAPIMFTNHPSKIFYSDNFEQARATMDQDAVANCWQTEMGKSPASDSKEVKDQCTQRWIDRGQQKCEMTWVQVCGLPKEKAVQLCASHAQTADDKSKEWCGPRRTSH